MKKYLFQKFLLNLGTVWRRILILIHQPLFWLVNCIGNSIILIGAWIFFQLESPRNPMVTSYFDALYWAAATVATVGYGDIVATTNSSRALAIALMIFGPIFLWTYTALIVAVLVGPELQNMKIDIQELEENIARELGKEEALTEQLLVELKKLNQQLKK